METRSDDRSGSQTYGKHIGKIVLKRMNNYMVIFHEIYEPTTDFGHLEVWKIPFLNYAGFDLDIPLDGGDATSPHPAW